jgi:hypothetical protein
LKTIDAGIAAIQREDFATLGAGSAPIPPFEGLDKLIDEVLFEGAATRRERIAALVNGWLDNSKH